MKYIISGCLFWQFFSALTLLYSSAAILTSSAALDLAPSFPLSVAPVSPKIPLACGLAFRSQLLLPWSQGPCCSFKVVRWHHTVKRKKDILNTILINPVPSASSVVNPVTFFLTMLLGGRMKKHFLESIVRMSQHLVRAFVWLTKKRQNVLTLHSILPNGVILS